jgi:hypothetical protein
VTTASKAICGTVAVVILVAVGIGAYWLGTRHQQPPVLRTSLNTGALSTTSTTTTTSPPAGGTPLSISVEQSTGDEPDSSILLPAGCNVANGVATASGTFNGGFVPEVYFRVGAVVELYVFTDSSTGDPQQIALLNGGEKPFPMYDPQTTWSVTAKLDNSAGFLTNCVVAVQATHDFEGAGNDGG